MYTCTCTGGTRVSREITTAYVCWAPTSIRYAGRKGCTLYTHTRGSYTCCPLTNIIVYVPIRKPQSCPMQEISLRLWLFLIFYSMYTSTSRGRGDPREIVTAYACWAPSSIPINAGAGWRSCTLYPLSTVIMMYTYSIMLCVVLLIYVDRGRRDPREIATAYACWAPTSMPINAGAGWRSCTLYPLSTIIMYGIMLCVVLPTYVDLWFEPLHVPWVTTHRGRCR